MRILIVEDVDLMREWLAVLLGQIKAVSVIDQARNLWEARTVADKNRPDLILLDEVLPGESILDFLKESQSRKIQVILMTSVEDPQHPLPKEALGRFQKPDAEDEKAAFELLESVLQMAKDGN